jgi:two-component SAPR family response regulator
VIILEQGRYKINPGLPVRFDVAEFEAAAALAARAGSSRGAIIPALEKAVALYRGPFLTDVYGEWAEDRRRELEELYLRALSRLARLYSEVREHARAIELLEKYVAAEPYHDEAYCLLIEQFLAVNDGVSACRIYNRFSEVVGGEAAVLSPRMRALRARLGSPENN